MSILDDTPLENVAIDIFAAAGVSNESLDFSYDPEAQEQPMENADIAEVVKTDDPSDDGAVTDPVDPEQVDEPTVDDVTDTPESPADVPEEGEVDTYISLEEDPEIAKEVTSLESLVSAYEGLKRLGGISRNDVYQVEALHPGVIPNGHNLNYFSAVVTPTGYTESMEGIGNAIIEKVKTILRYIADKFRQLGKWITTSKGRLTGADTNLKESWAKVLEIAKKIDSRDGNKLLHVKYKDNSIARKSSSVQHFVRLTADHDFKNLGQVYLIAYDGIYTNGDIGRELSALNNKLHTALKSVTTNVERIRANNYTLLPVTNPVGNVTETRAEITKKYGRTAKVIGKTFEGAIAANQSEYIKVIDGLDDVSKAITKASAEVDGMQRNLRPDDVAVSKAVSELNKQVAGLNAMYSTVDVYNDFYRRYNKTMNGIINRCQTILVPLGGLKP